MSHYQPGTILLIDHDGLVPAGIRLFTRSPWNHAAVCLGDGRTVEAGANGAFIGSEGNGSARHLAVNVGEFTDQERQLITMKALSLVGVPYNFLDIVLLAIHGLTGRLVPMLTRRVAKSHSMICSQLAAVCWQAAGYQWGQDPSLITPADIGNLKGTVVVK